jgi:hypothetical protein
MYVRTGNGDQKLNQLRNSEPNEEMAQHNESKPETSFLEHDSVMMEEISDSDKCLVYDEYRR